MNYSSFFRTITLPAVLVAAVIGGAAQVQASPLFFSCIEGGALCEGVKSQFQLTVADGGSNAVDFTYSNSGPLASVITQIYLKDSDTLFSGFETTPPFVGTGVSFSPTAPGPPQLPGDITFDDWAVKALAPSPTNGAGVGESITYSLLLAGGNTFADVEAALQSGALRAGIHVQSVHPTGGSISLVTDIPNGQVPEPSTWMLMSMGLVGFGLLRRKRNSFLSK